MTGEEVIKLVIAIMGTLGFGGLGAAIWSRIDGSRLQLQYTQTNNLMFQTMKSLEDRIADMKVELSVQKEEVKTLREENRLMSERFQTQIRETENELARANRFAAGLENDIINLKRDNEALTTQISHLTRINQLLTSENTILRGYYDRRYNDNVGKTAPILPVPKDAGYAVGTGPGSGNVS